MSRPAFLGTHLSSSSLRKWVHGPADLFIYFLKCLKNCPHEKMVRFRVKMRVSGFSWFFLRQETGPPGWLGAATCPHQPLSPGHPVKIQRMSPVLSWAAAPAGASGVTVRTQGTL